MHSLLLCADYLLRIKLKGEGFSSAYSLRALLGEGMAEGEWLSGHIAAVAAGSRERFVFTQLTFPGSQAGIPVCVMVVSTVG